MGKNGAARDVAIAGVLDNLRRVFQVVHGDSKRAERAGGLTGPQLWAVKVLSESGPARVSDLARRMYLHPSTVVGILDRLESRDLAERTRSREDRRVVTVALTRKGMALVPKIQEAAQGLLLNGLEGLSPRDLRDLSGALDVLVKVLGAHRLPPRLPVSSEVNVPKAPAPRRRDDGRAR